MRDRVLRLVFDPRGRVREAALACEAEVFLTWYGNTREQLAEEYGPYEPQSVFIALVDEQGDVPGACRLIVPGASGLKTLADVARPPWQLDGARAARAVNVDPCTTWDIATLGVRPKEGRGGLLLAAALYHGLVVASRVNGVQSVVSMMDEKVRSMLVMIGMITHLLPGAEPAPYLGSPATSPVYGHCDAMVDHQRRTNPDAYRLISLGIGLDGVSVPPLTAFRLRPRGQVVTLPVAEPQEVLDLPRTVTVPQPLTPARRRRG